MVDVGEVMEAAARHICADRVVAWVRRLVVVGLGVCAGLLIRPVVAHAVCAPPVPRLIWSYPADGAIDVPTNARIFLLTTGVVGAGASIVVNGKTVTPEMGRFGFGPILTPHTEYVVVVPGMGYDGKTIEPALSFWFTTADGPGPADPPPVPTVSQVTKLSKRGLSQMCQAAVDAMDCFDTGQDTHLVFETVSRPTFFFIVPMGSGTVPWTMLWPGVCGDPEVFVSKSGSCTGGYRLVAVGPTGESSSADVACDRGAADAPATRDGCAIAGVVPRGLGTGALLSVLIGALWWRRRRVGERG